MKRLFNGLPSGLFTSLDPQQIPDQAREYFEDGFEEHLKQDFESAIHFFRKSISLMPTAEAFTCMAWSLASRREFEAAIDACHKALRINPDYAYAMNDLGAYLIEIGQADQAIDWFLKAIQSPTYPYKFYSFYNLAIIYQDRDMIPKSLSCLRQAIDQKSDFQPAIDAYERLRLQIQ